MKKNIIYVIFIALVFSIGCGIGFGKNWYMSGVFSEYIRSLPKEKRVAIFRTIGVRGSPTRLRNILVSMYPNQPPEEHETAHLIGEAAYTLYGAKGFDYCDSSFTFACFHGVIFGALKKHGYTESVLKELAEQCSAAGKNDTARVSCAHGIGHGIMWIKNYEILESFELCDRIIGDEKLRFFCWDGVSMENVVRRGENAALLPKIPWKEDNIYYPCDSVPEKYQAACVREHLFLLRLIVFNRDTKKSQEYCMKFKNELVRNECFGALGGALDQDDPKHPEIIISECLKIPDQYQMYCLGRAATLHAYARDALVGQRICAAVSQSQARMGCMKSVEAASQSLYVVQFP